MEKGFTIVEILVAISIIVILTSVLFVIFPKGRQQFIVQKEIYKLAQDLRGVQEMAMSAKGDLCSDGSITHIFGVYFNQQNPESYILFGDCNKNCNFESSDKIIKNVNLENGVKICSLSPSSPLKVVFIPPNPETCLNGDCLNNECTNSYPEAEIGVCYASNRKNVRINKAGLIEIQ